MIDFDVNDSFAQPDFLLYGGGPGDKKKKKKGTTRPRIRKPEEQPDAQRRRNNPIQRDKRAAGRSTEEQQASYRRLNPDPIGFNEADELLYEASLRADERFEEGEQENPRSRRKKLVAEVLPPGADTLINPTTHHTEDDWVPEFDLDDEDFARELFADESEPQKSDSAATGPSDNPSLIAYI